MKRSKNDSPGTYFAFLRNESKSTIIIAASLVLFLFILCAWQWSKVALLTFTPVSTTGVITDHLISGKTNKFLYTYKAGNSTQKGEVYRVIPFTFGYDRNENIRVIYSSLNSSISCPERSFLHEILVSVFGLVVFVGGALVIYLRNRISRVVSDAEETLDHKKQIEEFERNRKRDTY